jgi:cation:H+ antiporter
MLKLVRAAWATASAKAAVSAKASVVGAKAGASAVPGAVIAAGGAGAALWTFPSILLSAFAIGWGAEAAQFFMSQGLALAILAWLQTLPEFAVEADIAWRGDVSNMTANFTGSLRLLVGLGWPMVFGVAALMEHRRTGKWLREIVLDDEDSVGVVGLIVPIAYFALIWWKATLTLWDSLVLAAMYGVYLWILNRMPAGDEESIDELDLVPRTVMRLKPGVRGAAITGLFVGGGLLLFLAAHPFVGSLEALALSIGISEFVFIQWVAPFLSEFPEFFSAFRWAKSVRKAPMALMNLVSSNINQWTMLVAMIPVAYAFGQGHVQTIPFDAMHRTEILLTILQSLLGVVLLLNMRFSAGEAAVLFALWVLQFAVPSLREELIWVYGALALLSVARILADRRRAGAVSAFGRQWRRHAVAGPDAA